MISSGPTAPGNGGFAKPQLPATVTGHGLGSLQGYLACMEQTSSVPSFG